MTPDCSRCAVYKGEQESKEPALCKWYVEQVLIENHSISECTEFIPVDE